MKSGIWLSRKHNYLVTCDGTSVQVEGSGDAADHLRRHIQGPNSLYSQIRDSSGDDFDPVAYIFNRAYIVNAVGRQPEEFSDEGLTRNREYLKMLEAGSNIPRQKMSEIRKF